MADINKKLDDILRILSENKKQFTEDIENLNNKIENKIQNIEKRLNSLEKNKNEIKQGDEEILDIDSSKDNINLNYKNNDKNINQSQNINNSKSNKSSNENNKEKKRGKYLKSNQKSEFIKNIQYLRIKEDAKVYKYSLSKYNEKSHSGYYYCSDTNCKGKGTYLFVPDNTSEYEKKFHKKEFFTLSKEHSLEYENHNYIINENTIHDIDEYNPKEIKKN